MNESRHSYCTFRSAGRWFGVPIEDVKEITTQTTCTRIPHAPLEVAGYVNIRGHIFLALDLRRLLGFDAQTTTENRLIIFKQSVGPAFGVLVDEMGDIVSVNANQLEPFQADGCEPAAGESQGRQVDVTGVYGLATGLLVVLEPRRFLRLIEQSIPANG
jgi:purine-binding chemotaxis protein CheW